MVQRLELGKGKNHRQRASAACHRPRNFNSGRHKVYFGVSHSACVNYGNAVLFGTCEPLPKLRSFNGTPPKSHVVSDRTETRSRKCPLICRSSKAICLNRSSKCVAAMLPGLRGSDCPRLRKHEQVWGSRSRSSPSSWAFRRAHCKTGSKVVGSPRVRRKRSFVLL